jgi:uncharacterized protein (TIGR03437 family)
VKQGFFGFIFGLSIFVGTLGAQPTITSVTNESGESFLCPGGIAFVKGTGLGTNTNINVTVGGKKAFVFNAFNASLQVELPVDAAQGATTITAGASAPFNITLGQYCPGLPSNNISGVAYVVAVHDNNGKPVTPSFPAIPDELVDILATGLGPTTPPVATGAAPNDSNSNTNVAPTVTIGGQPAKVINSFLNAQGGPGFYYVVARTPATITTGNQSVKVTIGGLTSNSANLPLTNGGAVSSVTNAATYTDASLPNGAIAQGAIAVVKGKNLGPSTLVVDTKPFQNTTLSDTSVAISVGSATVSALMYYTSFNQIAFLIPSNAPVGTGTITVTYAGQAGAPSPITIVPSNVGIFTISSDGQGEGIVTYADYSLVSPTKAANCGGVNTTCGAANPGDVLIIWATGLGPVNGSDSSGAGLGVNMSQLPLTVFLGGVQVQAVYQGRSGCCIGEDQIVFTVPTNTPLGCDVPLFIQNGSVVSNGVSLPVAATGSRTCTLTNPGIPSQAASQLSSAAGPFTLGTVDLKRKDQAPAPGFVDNLNGTFIRFTIPAAIQPFFVSYADIPALGTCQIFNNPNGQPSAPIVPLAGLDAGSQITIQGPNGSKNIAGGGGTYKGTLSANGTYLASGTYTVSAPGGADVPKFSTQITIPTMPTLTSPTPDASTPTAVTRSNGLTVTWTGGQPNQIIQIEGFNSTDNTGAVGADFLCVVSATPGSFTIPSNILSAMPPGSFGGLSLRAFATPAQITGTGLNVAFVNASYDSFAPLNYK